MFIDHIFLELNTSFAFIFSLNRNLNLPPTMFFGIDFYSTSAILFGLDLIDSPSLIFFYYIIVVSAWDVKILHNLTVPIITYDHSVSKNNNGCIFIFILIVFYEKFERCSKFH
jgi:hypothetical protein